MKKNIYLVMAGLLIAIMLIAFIPSNTLDLRLCKQMLAEWGAILFIALFFVRNPWLKGFLIWSMIRLILSYNGPTQGAQIAYFSFNTILYFVVFFQVLSNYFNRIDFAKIFNAVGVAVLINSVWLILQYFGIWVLFEPNEITCSSNEVRVLYKHCVTIIPMNGVPSGYYSGLFSNMNMAASFQALGLVVFFRKRWRWFIPVVLAGLVISQTLGGVLPAAIATGIYVWVKHRKSRIWLSVAISIGVIAYIGFVEDIGQIMYGNLRFELWRQSFKIIKVKFWTGWGIGQFKYVFPAIYSFAIKGEHSNLKWVFLHNEYLQLWIDQGLIGLTLAIGFIGSLIVKGLKNRHCPITFLALLGLLVGMINAGGNFLFHTTPVICLLTYMAVLDKKKEEQNA